MRREHEPVPAALRPIPAPQILRLALRPAEAAIALGVSDRHLRNLTNGPPTVRLGSAVLYPVAALEAWLAARVAYAAPLSDESNHGDDVVTNSPVMAGTSQGECKGK